MRKMTANNFPLFFGGGIILVLLEILPAATAFLPHITIHTNNAICVGSNKQSLMRRGATKEATFGMGCFWKPSEELLEVDGVVDTVVGYTGHPTSESTPNYDSVCFSRQWVEGIRVQYDDDIISYEDLLDEFYDKQEAKIGSRQYGSFIFAHDENQNSIAQNWVQEKMNNNVSASKSPIQATTIEPLSRFFKAEGYHQEYWQKMRPRIALGFSLLMLLTFSNPEGGVIVSSFPDFPASIIEMGAEILFFAGAIYILLERKVFDKKVFEL